MTSPQHGEATLAPAAEVVHISPFGIWVWVQGQEYLLSFDDYPWFQDATARSIHRVELHHGRHLRWPELDVDVEVDCLEHPERYPLTSRP